MSKSDAEHHEQAALIEWYDWQYPHAVPLLAIPNGGHRHIAVAVKMQREGVRPGVPDLMLPIARGGWHGLWIEMKTTSGRLSKVQRQWRDMLQAEGYRVELCRGFEEARAMIEGYLEASDN